MARTWRWLAVPALLWPFAAIASFTHPNPREALIRRPPAVCSSPAFVEVDLLYVLSNGLFLPVGAAIHAYDAAGDITATDVAAGLMPQLTAGMQRFSQNDADELTEIMEKATPDAPAWTTNACFSDRNGNLTNAAGMALRYDSENRLTSTVSGSTSTTATYDGQGNRVKLVAVTAGQTNVTWLLLDYADPLRRPLAELDSAGNPVRYFVWGRGLVAQVETNGTIRYFHADGQGSTLALTDNAGTPTDAWFYSPYGQTLNRTGSTAVPFTWAGGYGVRSDASGLYFMRHRYYHPGLMRFVSADPVGIMAGGGNLYWYANGSPLVLLDPHGLWSWDQTFGVMRAVGGGLEAGAGYGLATASAAFGAASSWRGGGLIAGAAGTAGGIAVGAHGVDQFQAGVRQAFTHQQVDSLTSVALQETTGMSRNTANLVDAGISVAGSIGAGLGTTVIRAQSALSSEAVNAPLWRQVLYHEIGQKTLPDDASTFYSTWFANPVDRGAAIVADQGWSQALRPQNAGWTLGIGKTFATGPTPLGWGGSAALFIGGATAGQYITGAMKLGK